MKSNILIFAISLFFLVFLDSILWIQIRQYLRKKWQISLYLFQSLFFITALLLFQCFVSRLKGPGGYFWIEKLIGILFLFYTPKLLFVFLNSLGLLFRTRKPCLAKILKGTASAISLFLFLLLLYSITWGRYNYKIENVSVPLVNLPAAFQEFTIVQLADLHLGSYGESYKGISRLVKAVNALHPDLIVFTGDMVNNFAEEMLPWISTLQTLQARYGKYAVTGNHDYGDYTRWANPEDKKANMRLFYENMEKTGFQMLSNTRVPIAVNGDTLWLAGVENWGNPPFPRYGRLDLAIDSLNGKQPIILLSHDPSHWRAEILDHPVSLTLSGHTHAMQMGIEINGKKWSPAQYLYPEYDGLYQQGHQYLYVSRGQGYLGFPGRIGLRPVITRLILVAAPEL